MGNRRSRLLMRAAGPPLEAVSRAAACKHKPRAHNPRAAPAPPLTSSCSSRQCSASWQPNAATLAASGSPVSGSAAQVTQSSARQLKPPRRAASCGSAWEMSTPSLQRGAPSSAVLGPASPLVLPAPAPVRSTYTFMAGLRPEASQALHLSGPWPALWPGTRGSSAAAAAAAAAPVPGGS